jgi:hypothetical protein
MSIYGEIRQKAYLSGVVAAAKLVSYIMSSKLREASEKL